MSRQQRCKSCGGPTWAEAGVCRSCKPSEARDIERGPVALTGGRWVTKSGIRVWMTDAQLADLQRRVRLQALVSERYLCNGWWGRKPEPDMDDSEVATARRRRALMAGVEQVEAVG